jgi:hypothetical protein
MKLRSQIRESMVILQYKAYTWLKLFNVHAVHYAFGYGILEACWLQNVIFYVKKT